jgi:hypothetical protein
MQMWVDACPSISMSLPLSDGAYLQGGYHSRDIVTQYADRTSFELYVLRSWTASRYIYNVVSAFRVGDCYRRDGGYTWVRRSYSRRCHAGNDQVRPTNITAGTHVCMYVYPCDSWSVWLTK